ncbi:RNA polymerase sigma factor [Kordiimonas sp.]|uniref:RNA polymerase sigma factor n=1 Tax=Kordiimonas sp. TaxID=1970157 RepID=UPI003A8ED495
MLGEPDTEIRRTLDQLFRREAGRLVASLTRKLGAHNLALAEDTAQDALLAASRTWPYDGMPENPAAWLHSVAFRKAIDLLRRHSVARNAIPALEAEQTNPQQPSPGISDSELRLLFLCCHPAMLARDRLALTLNIAFGFSAREIARLFHIGPAAMSARLMRCKECIRGQRLSFDMPMGADLAPRVAAVQKVIYLAFSLGYSPGPGALAVRTDIALEALRLAESLCNIRAISSADAHALAALLCFQASRLTSRTGAGDTFIPLTVQNRELWDQNLIMKGFHHLKKAQTTPELNRYHLEAGIAALHATARSSAETDWRQISLYYEQLWCMTRAPIVALNHAIAIAMAGDNESALEKLDSLSASPELRGDGHFHTARAEILHRLGRLDEAHAAFKKARFTGGSDPDMKYLDMRLSSFS